MALGLTLTNPRPGGVMSAFCEPATTTSMPHPSVLNVQAPSPETASTMVTTSAAPLRSEEHTSELQSHSDLHSFPTRRSSDLRAGDYDVDAPPVRPQRTGPESRDRIDDGDDVRCAPREALDVVDGARRGLREHADCGFDPRVIRQRLGDLVVVSLLAPFVLQLGDLKSEGPAHLDPPAAEVTVVDDQDLVSRRKQVLDRPLERPGPARRVSKDVVLCQKDALQVLVHPGEHLAELGRAVVNNG